MSATRNDTRKQGATRNDTLVKDFVYGIDPTLTVAWGHRNKISVTKSTLIEEHSQTMAQLYSNLWLRPAFQDYFTMIEQNLERF